MKYAKGYGITRETKGNTNLIYFMYLIIIITLIIIIRFKERYSIDYFHIL